MPAPSPLAIATNSLTRLTKEATSYYVEKEQQKKEIAKLEAKLAKEQEDDEEKDDTGNDEFMLKQQKTALEQTDSTITHVKKQIVMASRRLKERVEAGGDPQEVKQAQAAIAAAENQQK